MSIVRVGGSPRIRVASDRRYDHRCRRKRRPRRCPGVARRGALWFRGLVVAARRLVAPRNAGAVRNVRCKHVFDLYSACRREWRFSDEVRVWPSRGLRGLRGGGPAANRACVENVHVARATVRRPMYPKLAFQAHGAALGIQMNSDTTVGSVVVLGVVVFGGGGTAAPLDNEGRAGDGHVFKGRSSSARISSPRTGPGVDHL